MMDREVSIVSGTAEIVDADEYRPQEQRGTAVKPDERTLLFADNEAQDLRSRWNYIQTGFVDEPRRSVQEADALVSDAIKRLTETFTEERAKLEHEWDRGENVSTEDLRISLRRYRSFFDRLLAI
jgi:hypothetical protein